MKVEVTHYKNGSIRGIKIRDDSEKYHNTSGPACQEWYKNGQEKYRAYFVDGKLHNPSGPAYQGWYKNGQEGYLGYCVDGKLHNTSGPARQYWHENGQENYRGYYIDGKLHNTSGPAYQSWYENGQENYQWYYVDGKELTKKEFQELQDTVEVTANGRTVRISKQSAKELNLF